MRTRKNLNKTQAELEDAVQAVMQMDVMTEEQKENVMKLSSVKKQADLILKTLKPLCKENIPLREVHKNIKHLKADLNMVFEWHDGILVKAMQTGGLLLIDEISLANDSVLERLNSVFEADRMLVLSEKSSSEAIKIIAQGDFNIVATMNPSGDFGKKELSPALRNRMTEIWVESYFLQNHLINLYNTPIDIHRNVSHSVDLFLITLKMAEDKLCPQLSIQEAEQVAEVLFNMIGFINFTLSRKFSVLQRKALSIRDVINAIDFVKVARCLFAKVSHIVFHAIQLVIMDGLCLGIDVAGNK